MVGCCGSTPAPADREELIRRRVHPFVLDDLVLDLREAEGIVKVGDTRERDRRHGRVDRPIERRGRIADVGPGEERHLQIAAAIVDPIPQGALRGMRRGDDAAFGDAIQGPHLDAHGGLGGAGLASRF